eukprot:EG_transcript_21965
MWRAILVFDTTQRQSYNAVADWLLDARSLANPHAVMLLVGNKVVLEDQRQVLFEEASRFATENGLAYLEASAKTGQNVERAFLEMAHRISDNIQFGLLDPRSPQSGIQLSRAQAGVEQAVQSRCAC